MKLNVENSKTVNFGRKNLRRGYFMSDSIGNKSTLERAVMFSELKVERAY